VPPPDTGTEPAGAAGLAGRGAGEPRRESVNTRTAGVGPTSSASSDRVVVGHVPMLSGATAIARALRPLHRKTWSRRADNVVLDEDATAERAVQDGLWLPETKPATERWLDLTLVVDASPSMGLWRASVRAFEAVLDQLGTFRTIQRRLLDGTRTGAAGRGLVPVLLGGTPTAPVREPATLLDPGGRRVMLVVTDGVSTNWRDPAFTSALALWGKSMPTALVHLLPQRLWRQCGLTVHKARLAARGRLTPNSRWSLDLPDAWFEPDPAVLTPTGTVPVPVLELEPRWLHGWANLVVGDTNDQVDATVMLVRESPPPTDEFDDVTNGAISSFDQVKNFRSTASPSAARLASLLAAVPVSVPVARYIQDRFVPDSGNEHLAEALTSGLFEPVAGTQSAWDMIQFTVRPEVREELLRLGRRSETKRVVTMVAKQFGDHPGDFGYISEALEAPDETPDPPISAETMERVEIQRIVMHALSGPYLPRAGRLSHALAVQNVSTSPAAHAPETPKSINMSDAAEQSVFATEASHRPAISVTEPPAASTAVPGTAGGTSPVVSALTSFRTFERPSHDTPPIWGNIPPRNPNFTGRVELLNQLGERLAAGGTTAMLPSALHGMGGIGKTQTAVEYIYRHLRDYDVVWWIQASHATQIRAGLTELAQALQLPGSGEANTAVPAVREALRRGQPERRWLLVFDAADSMETVRPFFPDNGPGGILITSRNPDWVSVATPLEVATFERAESIELLRRRGPEIADEDADRLAETLGDLPLAIEQAAAWRAETGMPVAEYLRLFDEKVAEILDTSAPTGYEVSVAAAWNVSFDELGNRSAAAHQLLQVCAFYSPEPISRHLFAGVRGISISPELDRALRDPMRLSLAIRDINRYGLAKIDHRNDTLQLHRLVQVVLRNRMSSQHQAEMKHGGHLLLANLDPNDPLSPAQWQRYRDVLPHAYAARLVECDDAWGRQLVINLMAFLYRWGDHDEAVKLAEDTLKTWTEKLGETDRQTLDVASRLGSFYWIVGRYADAARLNLRTLEIRREVDGENSEATLLAQLAVVADRRAAGDFTGAAELGAEGYQRAKAMFGTEDPVALTAARRYCISLRLVGRFQDAAALDDETHQRLAEVLGQDHPDTLSALAGWILDRREAGDYIWARQEQERLAVRAREIHGDDNADTLRRFAYLAVARRKAGDHEGALELSTSVLERFRIRYGLDNFNAMACALGHSIDLRHSGDLRSAKALGEEAVERYRRNMGEDHPYTYCAIIDLAVTLRLHGDAAGAKQLDERALEQLRLKLGTDHVHSIICAINLASDHAALGDTEVAVAMGIEASERSNNALGVDHPTSLAASLNLVLDLRTLNRGQEAESRYADVLTRYRKVLGNQHPATIAAGKGIRADCDLDPLPL
jgi:hypothetical protein